jgi:hypothetical protein
MRYTRIGLIIPALFRMGNTLARATMYLEGKERLITDFLPEDRTRSVGFTLIFRVLHGITLVTEHKGLALQEPRISARTLLGLRERSGQLAHAIILVTVTDPLPIQCYDSERRTMLASYRPKKMRTPDARESFAKLTIYPEGQDSFDRIVLTLLVLERYRLGRMKD